MKISEAEYMFIEFLNINSSNYKALHPRDLLNLVFKFYEDFKAEDARPFNQNDFGDNLLFQYGMEEDYSAKPRVAKAYYIDLTRQFIDQLEDDDNSMFQLSFTLKFKPELALTESGDRWCENIEEYAEFKEFVLNHDALTPVLNQAPIDIEICFGTV